MRGIWGIHPGWGITAVRIAVALILIAAGYEKWMTGVEPVVQSFARSGIPVPEVMGPYIVALELVGGALLLLGVAGRWVGLLVAAEFAVATFYVKMPALGWAAGRIDLMLLAAGMLFFLAGPGRAAVDEFWLERTGD